MDIPTSSEKYIVGAGGWTPLYAACYKGHLHVFQALRENGVDTESTTIEGSMPLHFACGEGHLAVVIELLRHRAVINANDGSSKGSTTIRDKRKSCGADTDTKDCDGDTPLHYASWNGHLAIVKVLQRTR
jgi:hypothetical protein